LTPDKVPTAVDLAYLIQSLLKAQRRYFDARKEKPHSGCDREFRAAREWEARAAAAAAAVIAAQQQVIPGMEGGGS
jgi:hypothetical protein